MLNQILQFAAPVIGTIFVLVMTARYEAELKSLLVHVGDFFYTPFQIVFDTSTTWLERLVAWLRAQAVMHATDGSQVLSAIIGAYCYLLLALGFILSEVPLASMTLEVWGFSSLNNGLNHLQVFDSGICVAIALLMSPVIWGLIFFDAINITHFAGCLSTRLEKTGRRILASAAILGFVFSVSSLALMAYDRGTIIGLGLADLSDISSQKTAPPVIKSISQETKDPLAALQQQNISQEGGSVSEFSTITPAIVMTITTLNIAVLAAICLVPGLFALLWTVFGAIFLFLLPLFILKVSTGAIAKMINGLVAVIMVFFQIPLAIGHNLANVMRIPARNAGTRPSKNTADNRQSSRDTATEERGAAAGFDPFA